MKGIVRFSACMSLAVALLCLFNIRPAQAQNDKRVVLQAFWWDYWNNNYPNGWYNYLADLAPRLRAMGIDVVWIPPSMKNDGTSSVGYMPFDHYDLGDKYQKGSLKTRLGDKDEFLRMVAVMHANGIEVVQDMVLNHMGGAGSGTGAGAIDDPAYWNFYNGIPNIGWDPTGGNKQFRYSSYATPATDESYSNFINRRGRWPKNWPNFFPNAGDTRITGEDLTKTTFGPDIAYNYGGYGQSSQGGYNPAQDPDYMRNQGRNWLTWFQKQTGVDGYRFDAVKHFPAAIVEDYTWNLMNNAGWASKGDNMLMVGEWVGSKSELDAYTDATSGRCGTFDFGLRGWPNGPGLYGLVYGNGNYDVGNLPSLQQDRRWRTFPFVNNHDTYRPNVDGNGNYTNSWGSELAAHIDPREPRLACAYAAALAMDGNPTIFFEDLFDVGTTGKRYSHLPTDTNNLPARRDIKNLIMCHNKLGFKWGAYKVPYQSQDHLIIERSGRAIIGINDNWDWWQGTWITTDFAPGTQLIDYGNSSPTSDVRTVAADRRVYISTPPCNGNSRRRGYSVWAPKGININADITQNSDLTIQEWDLDDDMGDSHQWSLKQGGRLPYKSAATRTAGKIYPKAGATVTVDCYLGDQSQSVRVMICNSAGTEVAGAQGTGSSVRVQYTPSSAGWYFVKVKNANLNNIGQRLWVKAAYYAPATIDARNNASWVPSGSRESVDEELAATVQMQVGVRPNPTHGVARWQAQGLQGATATYRLLDVQGRQVLTGEAGVTEGLSSGTIDVTALPKGFYRLEVRAGNGIAGQPVVVE